MGAGVRDGSGDGVGVGAGVGVRVGRGGAVRDASGEAGGSAGGAQAVKPSSAPTIDAAPIALLSRRAVLIEDQQRAAVAALIDHFKVC